MPSREVLDKETIDRSGKVNFKDLSPFKNFTKMQNLFLTSTAVKDLEPISNCKQLKKLWSLELHKTEVTDYRPLANLPKLRELYINSKKRDQVWRLISGTEEIQKFVSTQNSKLSNFFSFFKR